MANAIVDALEEDFVRKQNRSFKMSSAVKAAPEKEVAVFGLHDPEEYENRYKPLVKVRKDGPIGELFGNGRGTHSVPIVDRNPKQILPGMWSFRPEVLFFLRDLTGELDKKFTPDVDPDTGFTRTGVHTGFAKLRCPAGYLQTPMSAKVIDNSVIREELGLTAAYDAREQQIADTVWDIVWESCLPSSVNVPKASAGGMRRFTHSVQWKLDYAQWKTQPERYDRFLSIVEAGDALALANDFEIVYGMYIQKRVQLDEIGKERLANDWKYALTSGRQGERKKTDKSVVLDGVRWDDFSALRVRVIDAGPWAVNCDLQIVATAHMRALFQRFPKTFHINTKEEIVAQVNGKYVYCSDVSEYDQSMSANAVKTIFNRMRNWYPEGLVRSAERLYEAPYYARPLEAEGRRGRWIADPMDWTQSLKAGNRSGHAFTSLVAKVNKVIETLCVIHRIYKHLPINRSTVLQFLQGELPMGTVNNGDDEIVWAIVEADIRRYAALRKDVKSGHYVVKPEVGQGYSGLLLVRPDPTQPVYVPTPRLQTALEKCYVPERSIGGVLRPYWPIGWMDRIDALTSTDAGREIWEIHNFYYEKHLSRYGAVSYILSEAMKDLPRSIHMLNPIDREVLIDPDKLHYKYDSDQINPEVIANITSNLPSSYCEGFLRRYYKGTFL